MCGREDVDKKWKHKKEKKRVEVMEGGGSTPVITCVVTSNHQAVG